MYDTKTPHTKPTLALDHNEQASHLQNQRKRPKNRKQNLDKVTDAPAPGPWLSSIELLPLLTTKEIFGSIVEDSVIAVFLNLSCD